MIANEESAPSSRKIKCKQKQKAAKEKKAKKKNVRKALTAAQHTSSKGSYRSDSNVPKRKETSKEQFLNPG